MFPPPPSPAGRPPVGQPDAEHGAAAAAAVRGAAAVRAHAAAAAGNAAADADAAASGGQLLPESDAATAVPEFWAVGWASSMHSLLAVSYIFSQAAFHLSFCHVLY